MGDLIADHGAAGDNLTDDTAAVQAALDAGGWIGVTNGATFKLTSNLTATVANTILEGHGTLRAAVGTWGSGRGLLEVTADNVWARWFTADVGDKMTAGSALQFSSAADCTVDRVTILRVQRAGVLIGDNVTGLDILDLQALTDGYGVLASDPSGSSDLLVRGGRFRHPGTGNTGDAVEINAPTHGFTRARVEGIRASGYIGPSAGASNAGFGVAFANVDGGHILRCDVSDVEAEGYHVEHSDGIEVARNRADTVGTGGNNDGQAFLVTSSDRCSIHHNTAKTVARHGFALLGFGDTDTLFVGNEMSDNYVEAVQRHGYLISGQHGARVFDNRGAQVGLAAADTYSLVYLDHDAETDRASVGVQVAQNTLADASSVSLIGSVDGVQFDRP